MSETPRRGTASAHPVRRAAKRILATLADPDRGDCHSASPRIRPFSLEVSVISAQSVIRSDASLGLGSPTEVQRAETLADLTRIFVPETQICVHSSPGSPNLLGALAGLRASEGSGLRAVVRLSSDGVPDIDALPLPPAFAHPALRRELASLLELYGDLLGCAAIGLRIERLDRAMCPRWHVDRTGIRMLCTWCGPGTEWLDDPGIDPRGLSGGAAGVPATGQARPFDIVLLKGSAWQGNAAGGAIHRSPMVDPGSGPCILVALDALWDD